MEIRSIQLLLAFSFREFQSSRKKYVVKGNHVGSCWINRHSRKCVDLAIKVGQEKEKDRLSGQEKSEERDGERKCRTYAASNYNSYNGIICLRIVAAKHCCTVKCSTINVHRAHSFSLLPSSAVYGPCGLKCIAHSLNMACRCIYAHMHTYTFTRARALAHTHTHAHIRYMLADCVNSMSTNAASFNLTRNRLLRCVHTLSEIKHVK